MTILERDVLLAAKDYYRTKTNIDWEQRRYEVAKELLVAQGDQSLIKHDIILACIKTADLFIYELKKQKI